MNIIEDLRQPKRNNPPPTTTKPFVLVLSLQYEDIYANIWKNLTSALEKKTTTVHIRPSQDSIGQALQYLQSPSLTGVLITDAGIIKKKYTKVVQKLIEFVKNGGSAAIGGQLSNNVTGDSFDDFMKKWGLHWKYGSYFRSTFYTNPSNELVQRNPSLPKSYSMKTLHVANIAPEMAVYVQTADSRLESGVWDPVKVSDFSKNESPAVCARVGRGLLGFVGDVNGEASSTPVLLAMLGVLDQPNNPPIQSQASISTQPPTGTPPQHSTRTQPKPSTSSQSQNKLSQPPMSSQPLAWTNNLEYAGPLRTKFFSSGEKSKAKPAPTLTNPLPKIIDQFVLVLELDAQSTFKKDFAQQLTMLESRITVKTVSDGKNALDLLASPDLHGVYVVDSGTAEAENAAVVKVLASYVHSGGLLVFGGAFPVDMDSEDMKTVFSALGVPWRAGSYCKSEAQLNRHHETAVRNPTLDDAYYMKAVHLRGFHLEAMLHQQFFHEYETQPNFEPPGGDEWESAVVRQRVGKGRLGYIGDVRPEPESASVLLAMLELLTPPKVVVADSSKFMLVLSGYNEATLQQFIPDFLRDAKKVEVHIGISGLSNARVIDLLPSRDLVGVLVTDSDVLYPQNEYLLSKLVEYSKNGGTLVFGWRFCKLVTLTQFKPLFRDNWGLDWDMISVHPETTAIRSNPQNLLMKGKKGEKLPKSGNITALQIKGIEESMAVYIPQNKKLWNLDKGVAHSSILFTPVEKGRLGYLGAATLDGELRAVIYAMFGIL